MAVYSTPTDRELPASPVLLSSDGSAASTALRRTYLLLPKLHKRKVDEAGFVAGTNYIICGPYRQYSSHYLGSMSFMFELGSC